MESNCPQKEVNALLCTFAITNAIVQNFNFIYLFLICFNLFLERDERRGKRKRDKKQ